MKVEIIKYPTDEDWIIAHNNALETQRKYSEKVPSSKLKMKYILSEHSPIRSLDFVWRWIDIPYWVAVHIRTHWNGIDHYISSQRNDIQFEYDRRKAPQDEMVNHRCSGNAQAILTISKARKCINASLETRQAWQLFLDTLQPYAPELVSACVKPCVYRNGICPELFKPCGFNQTEKFMYEQDNYLSLFEYSKKEK
jgi:hypothetical protein